MKGDYLHIIRKIKASAGPLGATMLIRFTASNFLSIHEPVDITFLADKGIKDIPLGLVEVAGLKERLVPSVVIYGPNGAGKTTILTALREFQRHIRRSAESISPSTKVRYQPFKLNTDGPNSNTRFAIDCMINGIRHHYGFEFDEDAYEREWLYSYPEGYARQLYVRDKDGGFSFGKTLRGQNKVIADITPVNALFLARAASSAHPYLSAVFKYFEDMLSFVGSSSSPTTLQQDLGDDTLDPRIAAFLAKADTGIQSIEVRRREMSEDAIKQGAELWRALASAMPPHVQLPDQMPESVQVARELVFGHVGRDLDEFVYLPLQMESRGTCRIVQILRKAFPVLDNGGLLVVDELDSSLHTLLAADLISLFADPTINRGHGQLLATIHDTNLLLHERLRRDQIWFAEKSAWGETSLTPLTDTRTRNTDNLERAYLQGRFGAVPTRPLAATDWLRD